MTASKRCFKCGQVKPLTGFYRHAQMGDGHLNKCKECTKQDVQKHRIDNAERVQQYDRERAKQPHRKQKNKLISARWRSAFPLRRKAQTVLGYAVQSGVLVAEPCLVCGRKAEAHHPDYSAPLAVVWLCPSHHKKLHAEARTYERQV